MVYLDGHGYKDPSDARIGSLPEPGKYHVIVVDVDEQNPQKIKVMLQVVCNEGNPAGQAGRSLQETFTVSEKAMPRLIRFAMCVGLLGPNEQRDVDLRWARGRQLIVEVIREPWTTDDGKEKVSTKISGDGMWPIGHADVQDVPVDQETLKQQAPLPGGAPQPQAAPPAQGQFFPPQGQQPVQQPQAAGYAPTQQATQPYPPQGATSGYGNPPTQQQGDRYSSL